jgi:hypothetical protein
LQILFDLLMPKYNPYLKKAFLTIVNNQLRDNNPPETNETLIRLMQNGHSENEAIELIAGIIASDVYNILSDQKEFDLVKYIEALNNLE